MNSLIADEGALKKFQIFVVAGFIPASIGIPQHPHIKMAEKSGINGGQLVLREGINPSPTPFAPLLARHHK